MLLGAVGAFNWSGGALLYDMHSRRGRFLNQTTADTKNAQYSYLGEVGPGDYPSEGGALERDAEAGHQAALGFLVRAGSGQSHGPSDRPWLGTLRPRIRAFWMRTGPPQY